MDASGAVHTQITDMEFIDKGIGNGLTAVGVLVLLPTFGIGGSKVDDHSSVTVDAGGAGIGVAAFYSAAFHRYQVSIVNTVQIADPFRHPCAADIPVHPDLIQTVIIMDVAGAVQTDRYVTGGRCPETETRLVGCPEETQIRSGIGIFVFEIVGRVEIVHSKLLLVYSIAMLPEHYITAF